MTGSGPEHPGHRVGCTGKRFVFNAHYSLYAGAAGRGGARPARRGGKSSIRRPDNEQEPA